MIRRTHSGLTLIFRVLTGWCLGILLLWVTTWSASAAAPKRVVFLYSYGLGFEPYKTFAVNFRTELAEQFAQPLEFHDVALESARLQGETSERLLVQYLTALFDGKKVDLVVPIGGPAARFAVRHRDELFPRTPMLFTCVDQRHLQGAALTTNDAVAAGKFDGNLVLKSALQLLPGTTNVVVVVGDSPLERFWQGEMKSDFAPFENRVNFMWFNQLPFSEMLNRSAHLPPHSVILYVLLCVDAEGVPYTQDQALVQLHAVANAPIFGFHDSQMGVGVIGGPLLAVRELSQNSVNAALRILHGERPDSIKIAVQGQGKPVFDWRELRRWNVDEARLPAGSTVLFRQPTPWQQLPALHHRGSYAFWPFRNPHLDAVFEPGAAASGGAGRARE